MPPRPRGLLQRQGLAALVALLALALLVYPALAHAELIASEPAAGSTVPLGLNRLVLAFNESPAPGSTIILYTGVFQPVAGVNSYVANGQLWADVSPALAGGNYTVQWTTLSADGHSVTGTFEFAVAPASPALPWALVVSLLVVVLALLGLIFMRRSCRPRVAL